MGKNLCTVTAKMINLATHLGFFKNQKTADMHENTVYKLQNRDQRVCVIKTSYILLSCVALDFFICCAI